MQAAFYGRGSTKANPVLLYRLFLFLALPLVMLRLLWAVLRGAEPWSALDERLGGGKASPAGALWLHAASNGELASVRPLVAALMAARPGLRVLVTTNTQTAQALARSWQEPQLQARMAPLDILPVLQRFLARHRPAALIIVENELWPNRILLAARLTLPVFIVGGRVSARSARRWEKFGPGRELMAALSAVSAQDEASERAYRAMGLADEKLLPRLNLKTAAGITPAADPLPWDRGNTLLAASTHAGEEEQVLAAFCQARKANPDLRLILAPRHPRRRAEIAKAIAANGLHHTARSDKMPPVAEVYLADTMGEMPNWYASAGLCFIGGTLVEKGGHTPFEPAGFGCALIHGPSVFNHAQAFGALADAQAAICVQDSAALAEAFALSTPEQQRLGLAAQAVLAPMHQPEALTELAAALLRQIPQNL